MNDIYLRFHERWILFTMRFTKSRKVKPETARQLVSYGLIAQTAQRRPPLSPAGGPPSTGVIRGDLCEAEARPPVPGREP